MALATACKARRMQPARDEKSLVRAMPAFAMHRFPLHVIILLLSLLL